MEEKILAPYVEVGGVPDVLESFHGLGGSGDLFFDVIVVAETEGDKGSKILEVQAEGYISVFNCKLLVLLKCIVTPLLGHNTTMPFVCCRFHHW